MAARTEPSESRVRAALAAAGGLLLALLSACATHSREASPPAAVNLSGYPLAFRQGYADGCASARRGIELRDPERSRRDSQYHRGWQDGFSICGRSDK